MKKRENILLLTWSDELRSKSLAERFGFQYKQINTEHRGFKRYIKLLKATHQVLKEKNVKTVIVPNPSIVLALYAVIMGKKLVPSVLVDAHNAGLFPKEGKNTLLAVLAQFIIKKADLTIVTNQYLANYVETKRGRAVVLPDPLPSVKENNISYQQSGKYIVYICSWALDEPYKEFLKATQKLSDKKFFVTGNFRKAHIEIKEYPNVTFPGFLDTEEYYNLLKGAELIVVLSKRENNMMCGIYEGIALERPVLTSSTTVLKEYFKENTVYFTSYNHLENGILEALKDSISEEHLMQTKETIEKRWQSYRQDFERYLNKTLS